MLIFHDSFPPGAQLTVREQVLALLNKIHKKNTVSLEVLNLLWGILRSSINCEGTGLGIAVNQSCISTLCNFAILYTFWRTMSRPQKMLVNNFFYKYHVCPYMLIFSKSNCPTRAANICWYLVIFVSNTCKYLLIFSKSNSPTWAANGPSWLSPVLSGRVPGQSLADVSPVSHCPQQMITIIIPNNNNNNKIPKYQADVSPVSHYPQQAKNNDNIKY